ncbi:MAG: leucine-rich repeat domain-containing protein [Bacteroidales bacterium]|nr:leucine-rich repeat domain-containing protein [Bacteroidales bacterium]
MKRFLLAILAVSAVVCFGRSHDFTSASSDGTIFYFSILSDSEVEVCRPDTLPKPQYEGIVTVPSRVKYDGNWYSVTAVGESAFADNPNMKRITIPSSVTRIGANAFGWCSSLNKFTVPQSTVDIEPYAFNGCISLESFTVSSANTTFTVDDGMLLSDSGTKLVCCPPGRTTPVVIPSSVTAICEGALYDSPYLSSVHIPLSITDIGRNAMYNCGAIELVTIPAETQAIERGAFGECASLRKFQVAADNPSFTTDSCAIYDGSGSLLHFAPASCTEYAVDPSTTAIGAEAFFRCHEVERLTLPDGLQRIGDAAMAECWGLRSIDIPATVDSIGFAAFALCEGLEAVYTYAPDPKAISLGDCAFYGANQEACALYVPTGSREAYASAEQWSDFAVIYEFSTVADQQIVWEQDLTDCGVGADLWLTAYATSALEVSYSIIQGDDLATLNGSRLHLWAPGTIKIQATQSGNAHYRPATPVTRTIDIEADALYSPTQSLIGIHGRDGFIAITGAEPSDIATVYTPDGRLAYQGRARTILLPPGIYITTIAGTTAKVRVL